MFAIVSKPTRLIYVLLESRGQKMENCYGSFPAQIVIIQKRH